MKRTVSIISALVVMLVLPYRLFAVQKHALVIGVGQQKDESWGRINVNMDVECVCKILHQYNFNDIVVIRDKDATKAGIVSGMKELAERCNPGDAVYVHFSGHGQQMTDVDGDEPEDGMDESWIPYDAFLRYCREDDGSRHLCDDEINGLLSSVRERIGEKGCLLVVVDACHSGGSTRDGDADVELPAHRGSDKVFELPACGTGRCPSAGSVTEDWLVLSACEDYQVNWEMKEPKVGKLTWCLFQLRDFLDSMPNDELLDAVTLLMESPQMLSPLPQNPRLEGSNGKYQIMDLFR